jgi:hypothetical protein
MGNSLNSPPVQPPMNQRRLVVHIAQILANLGNKKGEAQSLAGKVTFKN